MNEFSQFWMQRSLNQVAMRAAREAIENLGKCLPCTIVECAGQIVTVSFDPANTAPALLPNLTVPVDSSAYDYVPYQSGDKGVVRPTDLYIGNISELGNPQATNIPAGNLSALVFTPVGKKSFIAANPNARLIQGPDGWINQTTEGAVECSIIGNQSGITATYGGAQTVMDASGITSTYGDAQASLSADATTLSFATTSVALNSDSITMTASGVSVTLNINGLDINGILFGTHSHDYFPGTGSVTPTGGPQ